MSFGESPLAKFFTRAPVTSESEKLRANAERLLAKARKLEAQTQYETECNIAQGVARKALAQAEATVQSIAKCDEEIVITQEVIEKTQLQLVRVNDDLMLRDDAVVSALRQDDNAVMLEAQQRYDSAKNLRDRLTQQLADAHEHLADLQTRYDADDRTGARERVALFQKLASDRDAAHAAVKAIEESETMQYDTEELALRRKRKEHDELAGQMDPFQQLVTQYDALVQGGQVNAAHAVLQQAFGRSVRAHAPVNAP
jgi:hypothetical protein